MPCALFALWRRFWSVCDQSSVLVVCCAVGCYWVIFWLCCALQVIVSLSYKMYSGCVLSSVVVLDSVPGYVKRCVCYVLISVFIKC